MSDFPVFFEVSEIKSHLESLKSNKKKIEYLIFLREELIMLCYHYCDDMIDKYLSENNIKSKFDKIVYYPINDIYQTHISYSEHILLLKHIDTVLLPYVREYLSKLDLSIIEDTSKIIEDHKLFDFQIRKIIDYINLLKDEKVAYLEWLKSEYISYVLRRNKWKIKRGELDVKTVFKEIYDSTLFSKIDVYINALMRHPEMVLQYDENAVHKKLLRQLRNKYFEKEMSVMKFNFSDIKAYANNIGDNNKKILYLEYVKKEARQNKYLFFKQTVLDNLIDEINIEIEFLNISLNYSEKPETDKAQLSKNTNLVKLRWQKDNVLLPYLFDVLFNEGFLDEKDLVDRHKVIAQSFLKNNGKPFTAKESDSAEGCYRSNTKSNGKPRNAYKVDKVIERLKKKSK